MCTALFNAEEYEKAQALLAEGEAQGMVPDKKLYEVLIKAHAKRGEIKEGLKRLREMRNSDLVPDKEHFGALVIANALSGSFKGE